jgi:hypothetical protein
MYGGYEFYREFVELEWPIQSVYAAQLIPFAE